MFIIKKISIHDDTIKHIPEKAMKIKDAKLLQSIRTSAKQFKAKRTIAMPKKYIK